MNETLNPSAPGRDAALAEGVKKTLALHFWIPRTIQFDVTDGWVTLRGSVDWLFQRSAIEDAIKCVPGMRGVTNSIHVDCTPITPHRNAHCVAQVRDHHSKAS